MRDFEYVEGDDLDGEISHDITRDSMLAAIRGGQPFVDAARLWVQTWAASLSSAPPARYKRARMEDFDGKVLAIVQSAMEAVPDATADVIKDIERKIEQCAAAAYRFSEPYLGRPLMGAKLVDWPGVAMCGPVGIGKTHLAFGLQHELICRGYPVLVLSAVDLAAQLRASFEKGGETADRIVSRCVSATVLVLDDLDKARLTPFVAQEVFRIIDERYRNRAPIVVTTNAAPSELTMKFSTDSFGAHGAAIVDRLADLTWIRLGGISRRGKMSA